MTDTCLPSCLTLDFEGEPLHTYSWHGEPVWVALEISNRLGYAPGRLVNNITAEWADEFIEDHDYLRLTGEALAAFKAETGLATDSVGSRAPVLVLLLEPGLYLALMKTHKPAGVRLRRFIAEEVLPRLVRELAADPVREEAPPEGPRGIGILVMEVVVQQRPSLAEIRETRLLLREQRLMRVVDLADRRFKVAELRKSAKRLARMEYLDEVGLAAVEVMAAEVGTGMKGVVAV